MRDAKDVAKSLRWILYNIKDCGSNTFEHAIHIYVGEAIQILDGIKPPTKVKKSPREHMDMYNIMSGSGP